VTAHRVGVLGALIAVAVLSLELAGAVAWKHHAVADRRPTSRGGDHQARWESLRGTELTLEAVQKVTPSPSLDSTLEDVTAARLTLER
jgi:hypothetical protein